MRAFRAAAIKPLSMVLLLLVGALLLPNNASANPFFNLKYTTLEQSQPFTGDFEAILKSGKLRILVPEDFTSITYLPRRHSPLAQQQRAALAFAESHGLMPELVIVKSFADLIPALVAGRGDVAINNLTINPQRRKKISFSVSVARVYEQVIVRKNEESINLVQDLNGKKMMVNKDSTFWHALLWLKKNKYPDIEVMAAPDRVLHDQILDRLVAGEIDATILDSNLVKIYQAYRDDFKVAVNFSGQRDIGWGIRKNAPRLVSEINRFLQLEHMTDDDQGEQFGDLAEIKKRRVLRVLLRNNAASYFMYKGELQGFEYELAREFAAYHDLRLEVVVPPGHSEHFSWLQQGRADIAMGFFEAGEAKRHQGLAFSRPYHFARQHIVVAEQDTASQFDDLDGYSIAVRTDSDYWESLEQLRLGGAGFELNQVSDRLEVEQLIARVASGRYQSTLAGEHILDIELARSTAVKSVYQLEQEVPHAIAMRAGSPELQKALDAFIQRIYRSEFYNVIYYKYFKSGPSVRKLAKGRVVDTVKGRISPYDPLVRQYADQYGFDWRLITAQMFQESGFNPKAKSFSGARGLMQVMPRTAKSLGISGIDKPSNSIKAGVKYMNWLRDRFDEKLSIAERLWFSLAAYNAGIGHVADARSLARRLGLDPDRWFSHTETAMLLLSEKKYAQQARYGFVRGQEPVDYVREIKQRFEAYLALSGSLIGMGQQESLFISALTVQMAE